MKTTNLLATPMVVIGLMILSACQSADNRGFAQQDANQGEKPVLLTATQRIDNIKLELKAAKATLTGEGKYDCCVHPACDWCLLKEGECSCSESLKAGKKVCPGCGLGWHNGEGVIPDVDADQVKWAIAHSHAEKGHGH